CQSPSSISTDFTRFVVPAAQTTMSTWPNDARHVSRRPPSDRASPTSAGWRSVRRPVLSMVLATSSTMSARRPVATTSAPACASPIAIARPMPDVPPTTTAVWPVRSKLAWNVAVVNDRTPVCRGRAPLSSGGTCGLFSSGGPFRLFFSGGPCRLLSSGGPCPPEVMLSLGRSNVFAHLIRARLHEMVVHRAARAVRVARANQLVDAPVRVGGVAQVAVGRLLERQLAPFVVERGHHLQGRRQDRIARGRRDAAMEVDVVKQEGLPIVHRREQPRDFVGERRELIRRRALRRHAGCADLQQPPRFVHVVDAEL